MNTHSMSVMARRDSVHGNEEYAISSFPCPTQLSHQPCYAYDLLYIFCPSFLFHHLENIY